MIVHIFGYALQQPIERKAIFLLFIWTETAQFLTKTVIVHKCGPQMGWKLEGWTSYICDSRIKPFYHRQKAQTLCCHKRLAWFDRKTDLGSIWQLAYAIRQAATRNSLQVPKMIKQFQCRIRHWYRLCWKALGLTKLHHQWPLLSITSRNLTFFFSWMKPSSIKIRLNHLRFP